MEQEPENNSRPDRMERVLKPRRSRLGSALRLVLTVAVSAGLIYYYMRHTKWEDIFQALEHADLWVAVPARVLPLVVFWVIECLVNVRLFQWFDKPMRFRDVFWMRGALYLLTLVNIQISTGAFVYYLWRKSAIPPRKLIGIIVFRFGTAIWFGVMVWTVIAVVLILSGEQARLNLNMTWIWIALGMGWLWLFHAWSYWHWGWGWGPMKKILDRESLIWSAFAQSRPLHWLKMWGYFLFQIVITISGYYLSTRAFGINVNMLKFMLLAPIVFLLQGLPIAFAQFGTTTMAWSEMFPEAANAAAFTAFTLFLPFISGLTRIFFGMISMVPAWSEWNKLSQDLKKE